MPDEQAPGAGVTTISAPATPVTRPAPAAGSPQGAPAAGDGDPRARAAALRIEAAALDAAASGERTVNVKVGPPHSEMHFGGTVVGAEFTPVPRSRLAALQGAARDAGVTLITEG